MVPAAQRPTSRSRDPAQPPAPSRRWTEGDCRPTLLGDLYVRQKITQNKVFFHLLPIQTGSCLGSTGIRRNLDWQRHPSFPKSPSRRECEPKKAPCTIRCRPLPCDIAPYTVRVETLQDSLDSRRLKPKTLQNVCKIPGPP